MERTQNRWWDGLLCGCLIVLSVLISFPFAEMGFNDDFSYVKTAYDYARTGHLIYNGWAAPMLGWQAVWGSWFIRLFGFSFSGGISRFEARRDLIMQETNAIGTAWLRVDLLPEAAQPQIRDDYRAPISTRALPFTQT